MSDIQESASADVAAASFCWNCGHANTLHDQFGCTTVIDIHGSHCVCGNTAASLSSTTTAEPSPSSSPSQRSGGDSVTPHNENLGVGNPCIDPLADAIAVLETIAIVDPSSRPDTEDAANRVSLALTYLAMHEAEMLGWIESAYRLRNAVRDESWQHSPEGVEAADGFDAKWATYRCSRDGHRWKTRSPGIRQCERCGAFQ